MRKLFGLLGFLGGTIFGLMFAAKSGKEMRKELAKGKDEEVLPKLGKELAAAGKNFVDAVKDAADEPVRDMIKKGQKRGNEMMKEAKKKFSVMKKKVKTNVKGKVKEAKKAVEEATKKTIKVPVKKVSTKKKAAPKKKTASKKK